MKKKTEKTGNGRKFSLQDKKSHRNSKWLSSMMRNWVPAFPLALTMGEGGVIARAIKQEKEMKVIQTGREDG